MSNPYEFGRVGRYASAYLPKSDMVELRDTVKNVCVRYDSVDLDLFEAIALLENEQGEVGPLSPEEIMFVLNYAACVEQNRELAPHDLEKFGEVGVSG